MIMLQAIANSHGVEPVRNGTALTITKATLRAQVYSAVLRISFAVLKAAAIENPRLITALTVVINAQKRNGMFIQDAYGADAPCSTSPAICLTKFELVMNLKTAKAIGLNIPKPLLLHAGTIVE